MKEHHPNYNLDNDLVDMPKKYYGRFHNACTDPCDMLQGPCACGAWHSQEEWPEDIQREVFGTHKKYEGPMPWPRNPIRRKNDIN